MMRRRAFIGLSHVVALAFAIGVLSAPLATHAQKISKTAKAGFYSVTLKVLPAETFTGPNAAMARDGGAHPNQLNGPEHPNHHLVVFVRETGKPVEQAAVSIRYRRLSPTKGDWKKLPVVRMHVAGKGLKTTHYGNNVKLEPARYEVRVTINESKPADFHFVLRR